MSKNISTTPPVSCTLCPRRCGADRAAGQTGFCGAGGTLKAARAALHFWEEPCISGTPGQRHRVFLGLHPQVLFLPELPHQRRGTGQRDHDRASGRNFPRLAGARAPTTSTSSPPASGGPGSSRRWTSPGPGGCVCPSSATPAATRRWRAWRRGAALSTSGWPI